MDFVPVVSVEAGVSLSVTFDCSTFVSYCTVHATEGAGAFWLLSLKKIGLLSHPIPRY